MMISTKGRYALLVMIDLAQHENQGNISLKAISERQSVSMKYLESIVSLLREGGLVISTRGKEGGYQLSRPAKDIKVNEIIRVTEGSLALMACPDCGTGGNSCDRADMCLTLPMWQELEGLIDGYLSRVSIHDLLTGNVR
jgi:Rrf2 family protein